MELIKYPPREREAHFGTITLAKNAINSTKIPCPLFCTTRERARFIIRR